MTALRREFDQKTRVRRLAFAEFKCEGTLQGDDGTWIRCNAALNGKRVEFDHDIAAELGGPATFENCRALCLLCHRAKYPADAAKIAKAKRQEASHVGAKVRRAKPSKPALTVAAGLPEIMRRFR